MILSIFEFINVICIYKYFCEYQYSLTKLIQLKNIIIIYPSLRGVNIILRQVIF